MNFPAKIVVRRQDGIYYADFASQLPLSQYEHVADFGTWYGSQMSYAPFRRSWATAKQEAARLTETLVRS